MKKYFYVGKDDSQCGPVDVQTLKAINITRDTLVWCDGMVNWTRAGEITDLAEIFTGIPPIIPPTPKVGYNVKPITNSKLHSYRPDNNLIWAILTTIFFSPIIGIIAIVKANQVDSLWAMGNKKEAYACANSVVKWCWVGVGVSLFITLLIFLLLI